MYERSKVEKLLVERLQRRDRLRRQMADDRQDEKCMSAVIEGCSVLLNGFSINSQ